MHALHVVHEKRLDHVEVVTERLQAFSWTKRNQASDCIHAVGEASHAAAAAAATTITVAIAVAAVDCAIDAAAATWAVV